ncbi:MAG: aminotransferase class IV [Bacteroidota bacterium]
MKRLLETIFINEGIPQNIIYHNQRFNRSRRNFWPGKESIDLYEILKIPFEFQRGLVRCRILYRNEIEEIQFLSYSKKNIESLKLIETDLDYSYKFEDRTEINQLLLQKENCDDILMIKNGYITDTSYANIVLNADNQLFTPKIPLLLGTKRQKLIDQNKMIPIDIKVTDLTKYSHFALINAFIDLHESNFQPISNIK